MSRDKIEKLEELLAQRIGENRKIVSTNITRLTAPGDNYGGLLLRVDVTLKNKDGKEEELNVVAKCIPVNLFFQMIFNIQVSVKKEIAFYDTVVPTLRQFQEEQGVENVMDFFPTIYGSRLNLNGSDVVDENSAIILENLAKSGYQNVDRTVGFDLATIKMILTDLATFHATSLALKVVKPEVFENKVRPHLTPIKLPSPLEREEHGGKGPYGVIHEVLEECAEIEPIRSKVKEIQLFAKNVAERPFFTVAHGDVWVNNIMVKFEDGNPVDSKFVDFQNYGFRSPVADLLFLMWCSVEQKVLEENFDSLIKFYHENFVENLVQLKCDPAPFSFENFLEEIRAEVGNIIGQVAFMCTFVVFIKKDGISMGQDPSKPPDLGMKDVTPEAKQRLRFILKKCHEKGWLQM
ncbi:hypothetical protein NQ318_000153 [Aromia moschata]|uniref:CHK kinase-like domain-containing protein n=1 Tax=Aromia moschata TaxID=1265417 RepID=A0AAV8XCJ1_9CUCU|nr:hypothetical protein NQ318_000153 [Aromia moschata]